MGKAVRVVTRWAVAALLVWFPAFGQTQPPRPEFEVASIRPSGPQPPEQLGVGVHIDGAQVTLNYMTLRDYIGMAYELKNYQISGPEWVPSTRFDIAAKVPAGAGRNQIRPMLRALLEDRFQMKTHRENREFAVYALVVAKGGLKMKESPLDPETGDSTGPADPLRGGGINVTAQGGRGGVSVNYGRGASINFANDKFEGRKLSMRIFTEWLGRFMDRPVVDMTDLQGTYDISLEFTPEDYRAMMIRSAMAAGVVLPPQAMTWLQGASGESLFAAVQTLGLKLDSRKAPLEVLVVDKIERMPTEN
jgi:uncharacterized protein (TIGR03435 family)